MNSTDDQGVSMRAFRSNLAFFVVAAGISLSLLLGAATTLGTEPMPPPWPKVIKTLSSQDFIDVSRNQLPRGVKVFGEGGAPEWLKNANPKIARLDLNGDGEPELIVAHAYWLSAKGVVHEIYRKRADAYERIGDLDAVGDVKILEAANGFNQLEGWASGDGERPTYARALWRYEGKEYRLIRVDNFVTNESGKRVYSRTRNI